MIKPRTFFRAVVISLVAAATASASSSLAQGAHTASVLDVARFEPGTENGHPWTVRDSIAVRYVVNSQMLPHAIAAPAYNDVAVFSPNRDYFYFRNWSGDLAHDEAVYTLSVFRAADVRAALAASAPSLRPFRQITMRSGFSNQAEGPAIDAIRWEDDHTLIFIGVEGRTSRRGYRFDVESGRQQAITPDNVIINSNGAPIQQGDATIFFTSEPTHQNPFHYPMTVLDHEAVNSLTLNDHEFALAAYLTRAGRTQRLYSTFYGDDPVISPDGNWVLAAYWPVGFEHPAMWRGYAFTQRYYSLDITMTLHNLRSGQTRSLVNAPAGPGYDIGGAFFPIYWSHDSKHALVFNTALPLDPAQPERAHTSYIVDVNVDTGAQTTLGPMPILPDDEHAEARLIGGISVLEPGRRLLVRFINQQQHPLDGGVLYTYNGQHWSAAPADAATLANDVRAPTRPADFQVVLREGPNDPQRLVATANGHELALTEADPALAQVRRAHVQTLTWRDSAGHELQSLLMLPPDSAGRGPFPLVVQLGDYQMPVDAFRPDGDPGTGYAAQALAAQGFAVLALDAATKQQRNVFLTPDEGPAQVRRVDDAIDMLRQRGVAGDRPIGLIGFSRSAFYTYYIATHPGRTHIGAAHVYDGITHGYAEYVTMAAWRGPDVVAHFANLYSGPGTTFWDNPEAWLDAPAFNVNRVTAAMLFTISGKPNGVEETIGAFEINHKPFEYHNYPDAGHNQLSPRQRASTMQASVDWMSFWLLNRDPAPNADDPGRTERWRAIRSDWQQRQNATTPGPATSH